MRTLVNTHHHGDHTYGNCLLPGATVVGHDRCRQAVLAGGLALQALLEEVDWGELEVWPPFVTFTERLTLYVDDLRVELISAAPAHTDNDIVVWIPERRVLFTGDLVFNGVTPLALMGTVAGWLRSLALVRDLGAERLVPGHGPVCGPEAVAEVEAYLRLVQDMARRGWEASLTPLETARQGREELGRFGEWRDPERLVANLHRAYAELRGEPPAAPLDILAAWRDMEALEGRRLRCLA